MPLESPGAAWVEGTIRRGFQTHVATRALGRFSESLQPDCCSAHGRWGMALCQRAFQ